MSRRRKLLVCGDTPTEFTGFGEVVRNVLRHFPDDIEIHIWGINYSGEGAWDYPKWRIYPTGPKVMTEGLGRFLSLLYSGDYTHVWLLNDLNFFTATDFPAKLRHVCGLKKVRSLLYFPVDARLEREWTEIIERVDVAAAYTQYAVDEVRRAGCLAPLQIVPHGVAEFMQPHCNRKAVLEEIQLEAGTPKARPFAGERDFLLFNAVKNEWRKDLYRTLEILAGLKAAKVPAKLILRSGARSAMAGVDLEKAGESLGLPVNEDWIHLPPVDEDMMVRLYNAADLYLTTTLGEGWGLGITNALACGCPVAVPLHTSCQEILTRAVNQHGVPAERFVPLELGQEKVFGPIDARLRTRVNLPLAAGAIFNFYQSLVWRDRQPLNENAREWLSWPRISKQIQQLLLGN